VNTEYIFELRNVTVPSRRDADAAVIEDVNWQVRAADFWVVGGLQGSGKSDLMFMLAGLTKPLRGCYELFGQDMTQHFGDEFLPNRLRVGMVFDDARLFGGLTIAENVALPVRYHQNLTPEQSASWIGALLKEMDVAEFAQEQPGAVARTWRRRAALARALALQPEVLFLENPLRGLDTRHVAWWVAMILKLVRGHALMSGKRMTVVASTDEFRPWTASGAQFAELRGRKFSVVGAEAPPDEIEVVRNSGGEI
jgi:ABC-type transporter Mla maintaining outer membrane lipid asymmetry ATPase subunit MlaF